MTESCLSVQQPKNILFLYLIQGRILGWDTHTQTHTHTNTQTTSQLSLICTNQFRVSCKHFVCGMIVPKWTVNLVSVIDTGGEQGSAAQRRVGSLVRAWTCARNLNEEKHFCFLIQKIAFWLTTPSPAPHSVSTKTRDLVGTDTSSWTLGGVKEHTDTHQQTLVGH